MFSVRQNTQSFVIIPCSDASYANKKRYTEQFHEKNYPNNFRSGPSLFLEGYIWMDLKIY